jgi:hypothetical protein
MVSFSLVTGGVVVVTGPNFACCFTLGLGLMARNSEDKAGSDGFLSLTGIFLGITGAALGFLGIFAFFGLGITPLEKSILLPKKITKISPKTDAINPMKKANGLGGMLKPRYMK